MTTQLRKFIIKTSILVLVIVFAVGLFWSNNSRVGLSNFGSLVASAQGNNTPSTTPANSPTTAPSSPTTNINDGKPIFPCDAGGIGGCIKFIDTEDYKTSAKPGDNIIRFILRIANILTLIGGAVAVIIIVSSSYLMFFAGGSDEKYKQGLNMMIYAVIGLIVSILAYTIVAVVSSIVVSDKLISYIIFR
jgi:Type IV secretion system pilin